MDSRLAEILETYRGRDKIIRLTAYSCGFVGGLLSNTKLRSLAKSLTILSGNLNETRTVLRLFDDVSMWVHCKNYGVGSKEEDLFLRLTTLIDNFLGQAYYPVEHIAWARDNKILQGKTNLLWAVGILLWLGSLCVSIIQSLWLLRRLRKDVENWRKEGKKRLEEEAGTGTSLEEHTQSRTVNQPGIDRQLQEARYLQEQKFWTKARERQLIVTIVVSLADACNAIHWLPPGFLWSGTFNQTVVGFFGTVSSAAMLYNYLNPVKPIFKEKDI
ncbi:peroxisomal membrane protein 11C-like [Actinia tenebrosa]|uniref:Peroxisomal membrane protein 11C-like n=1 Tax=Actinia tenebrosa TaxID=6105 RepID=A0A6P8HVW8_ACTTE|nr:peroxisomal membrane protein 11C-like [Actinia tenebrosa]